MHEPSPFDSIVDMDDVASLIVLHRWLPLSALVIFSIVRLLKSDTVLPTVPSEWRAPLAVALGFLSTTLQVKAGGLPWTAAISSGVGSAFAAIGTHEAVVEKGRGGKEVPIPAMLTSSRTPEAQSPPRDGA